MSQLYPLKIDIFNHILPEKYKKALDEGAPGHVQQAGNNALPTLWDLDHRFRIMDKYQVMQVLTISRPPIEEVFSDPKKALDITKMANDELAEIVLKHRDRFPAGVAAVSLTDVDGSLKELERAILDLRFRGVQVYTNVNGKPLSSPEFEPLFAMMARYDLPIWIHPTHGVTSNDYSTESGGSKHAMAATFGWPYETTLAMNRIVFSGLLAKYPNLKIITHHCGAFVPFYEQRIIAFHDVGEIVYGDKDKDVLIEPPINYYKRFYADTAIYGNTPALMLGRAFFSIDHLLFGTDFPFAGHYGERVTRQTIEAIDAMDVSVEEKKKIYEDNARRIMRLPI
jgi:predicted TIM-barrel fold metal-dependent hydrolase